MVVSDAFDAADDYIADRTDASCVVVTNDILLADRCVKRSYNEFLCLARTI